MNRSTIVGCLAFALTALITPAAQAQDAHRAHLAEAFRAELTRLADGFEGVAGVHVVDLEDDSRFGVRDDWHFPQASAIKVPILLELFRRAEGEPALLRRQVPVTDANRTLGSGVLRWLGDGTSSLSLEDHGVLMIKYSDNTSTNVLIDALGMDAVNALSRDLGAGDTLLQRKMIRPEASARGDENLSTPRDAASIMARIHHCEVPMDADACARVREILELRKSHPIRDAIDADVPIAFKPGGITGVGTVWALVDLPGRPYAFAVMANHGGDAGPLMAAVAEAAHGYFSRLAGVTRYGTRVPLELLEDR